MEVLKTRLTEKEKTLENAKRMIDHYIPDFMTGDIYSWVEYDQDLANYKLYNNQIDEEEFKAYCDPLGVDESLAITSSKLKPYNIGAKNIDVLLGEELKRNDRFSAALLGESGNAQRNLELQEKYKESIQAELQKLIVMKQVEMEVMSPEEAQQYMQYLEGFTSPQDLEVGDFQSELEILANKIIHYAYYAENIVRKKNDGFFHALLSDKEIIYVGSKYGKPTIQVRNPLFVFFEKSPDTELIEYGNWAGELTIMTISDVIKEYGEELTEEELEDLEDRIHGSTKHGAVGKEMKYGRENTLTNRYLGRMASMNFIQDKEQREGLHGRSKKASGDFDNTLVEVVHFEWKWQRKIGFLEYMDEYGEMRTNIVDSSYPVPKEAEKSEYRNKFDRKVKRYEWFDEMAGPRSIEWMWIDEVWEITRIDGNIYTRFRRVPDQYISIDNPFDCKLSYHGRRYTSVNAASISAMGRQKPYIMLHIIIMYQIGELIAKNFGPVINIDTSMIDPNLGNGDPLQAVPKTLAYLQRGINLYNSLNNNKGGALISRSQPGNVSNMSTTADLVNLLSVLQWIDIEAGMSIGVSPQRKAQFSSNSNVTDNQQSITQSSHITERRFFLHNELWASVIQSYVDKFRRWASKRIRSGESVELNFILPDKSREVLKMSNVDMAQLNIFATHSSADDDYINAMQELLLVYGQNNGSFEDISNILLARARGTSPEEIHKMITINERKRMQSEESLKQQELDVRKALQQMQIDNREDEQAHEIQKIQVEGEEDRKTEVLKAQVAPKPTTSK